VSKGSGLPTTTVSLFVTIAFALPGYVFHRTALRRNPERTDTAVTEVLSVLFASIAIDTFVILLLLAAGAVLPVQKIDAAGFIADPQGYVAENVGLVAGWASTGFLLALLLAVIAGLRPWRRWLPGRWREWADDRERRYQDQQSAWWRLFHDNPDSRVYVGCTLDDGSYVSGFLNSYSKVGTEHADRELTLRAPITYRPSGDSDAVQIDTVGAVAVSARHIVLMTVTYTTTSGPPAARSAEVPTATPDAAA
jgi:Family of unknown function (DUF6338)